MADYRTDEEQIELLKKWWNEHGKSMVAGAVVAVAAYGGWMSWQGNQQAKVAAAADSFQTLLLAAESPGQSAQVVSLAEQLNSQHAGTVYSIFAALQVARDAVKAGDLPKAAEWLERAREQKPDASLEPVIGLRLARVQSAQGELDKALETLASLKPGVAWQPEIDEVKGDVLLAQGKREEARASYEIALKNLEGAAVQTRRGDLEMKLADLAAGDSTASTGGGH